MQAQQCPTTTPVNVTMLSRTVSRPSLHGNRVGGSGHGPRGGALHSGGQHGGTKNRDSGETNVNPLNRHLWLLLTHSDALDPRRCFLEWCSRHSRRPQPPKPVYPRLPRLASIAVPDNWSGKAWLGTRTCAAEETKNVLSSSDMDPRCKALLGDWHVTHSLLNRRRLFVIAQEYQKLPQQDFTDRFSLIWLMHNSLMFELPAISPQRPY